MKSDKIPSLWEQIRDDTKGSSSSSRGSTAPERALRPFAPIPDLAIILDLSPETAISRIEKNRGERPNHFEGKSYLVRVREIFQAISGSHVHHLDANVPEDLLARRIRTLWLEIKKPG
ncbi:MAG: hypothetical protein HY760_07350 [Nitrospirae bacterium]|nr:hypothetical protein [Nitrospirota bacterium]